MAPRDDPGLYDPRYERDSCGFGLLANLDNVPSRWLVETSLASLARMAHRGAVAAEGKSGDGCGVLLHPDRAVLWRGPSRCNRCSSTSLPACARFIVTSRSVASFRFRTVQVIRPSRAISTKFSATCSITPASGPSAG